MFGLGLFNDSFLKFLLTVSPAWCVLTALAVSHQPLAESREVGDWAPLHPFTLSPFPRSSCHSRPHPGRGDVARLLRGPGGPGQLCGGGPLCGRAGGPATDLVLLNAPGEAEVWGYYDPGLPVLALPAQRPPDRAATEATLAESMAGRHTIYALFWATEQIGPGQDRGGVAGWHAFKGLESWQGNVRFVTYDLPPDAGDLRCTQPDMLFGEAIRLGPKLRQPPAGDRGENALISLDWQTDAPLDSPLQSHGPAFGQPKPGHRPAGQRTRRRLG